MKNSINPYNNFSTSILRSPLYPLEFSTTLLSKENTTDKELQNVCRKDVVKEAIFLASPDLYNELQKWLNNEISDIKKIERLKISLTKYLIRMSIRCTPFGLFAGCTVGKVGDKTNIKFSSQKKYFRHTRLDMNYLCALAQDLSKHPQIKDKILYFPNSSIYESDNQIRYVEYHYTEKSRRIHHIVAVDNSEYLQTILKASTRGAYKFDLAKLLVDDEITMDDANEFVDELISSQLLVSEIEPAITGNEFLEQIIDVLNKIEGVDEIKKSLLIIKEKIKSIDKSSIGTPVSKYYDIVDNIKPLGTEYELKFMFQTDMIKPAIDCTIENDIIKDVRKGIEIINMLTPSLSETNMSKFREAFYERYEETEVPLLQALDIESGIGYLQNNAAIAGDINPLVDDILLPRNVIQNNIRWDNIQSFLLRKYNEAIIKNKYETEITENDLKELSVNGINWDDLPLTFSTMIQIVEDKTPERDKYKIYINSVGNPSATNLLGRFGHADKEINKFVKEITLKESEIEQNAIFAEIVHLPEARLGNILLRPVLRDYEIPYFAKSAVDIDYQIKLDDLMLSVHGNRIVLRSKRLNKEIIPRLSSAHNYSFNALPIYQFLCDLQTQNLRGGLGFSWGAHENDYAFLPRFCYKNLIFHRATWNIKQKEITDFMKIKDEKKLLCAVEAWREAKMMPINVLLADGDNELLLNLKNVLCVKTLLTLVKKRFSFKLVEFLFSNEHPFIKNEEGMFTNQVILSFYKNNPE